MQKQFTCIIPVRYQSSRFEGKPLAKIAGKEMLRWVFEHAKEAELVKEVVVAAYDEKIESFCDENGIPVTRVTDKCKNGSEAVADAAAKVSDDWIFEMQGDQPLVTPDIIDDFLKRAAAVVAEAPDIDVVIPYAPATEEHTASMDVLKVVKTESDRLVFQTRQPIQTGWRTLGLYLWKKEALTRFASLPVSDIEKAEDSHPIRLYVNDIYVQGLPIDTSNWVEVDREHQLEEVERIMKERDLA